MEADERPEVTPEQVRAEQIRQLEFLKKVGMLTQAEVDHALEHAPLSKALRDGKTNV